MGYLIKSDVIDALKEDMGNVMMCYEGKERKDIVAFCYESMERIIEELPQYWPDNMSENTGLTPEQIRELKERDTVKAPIKDTDSGVRYTDDYICPNCGKHFTGTGIAGFCYHCGQRIRWED